MTKHHHKLYATKGNLDNMHTDQNLQDEAHLSPQGKGARRVNNIK